MQWINDSLTGNYEMCLAKSINLLEVFLDFTLFQTLSKKARSWLSVYLVVIHG